MEAFTEIRRKAMEKRDKAIATARAEYAETLSRIAAIEQDILGRDSSSHKSISSAVYQILPQDRPFTLDDLMASLEGIDPGRLWRRRSVDSVVFRLRERGILRRLRRSKKTDPAIYVRVGVKVEPRPFENMTIKEVAAKLLAEKPMSQTELVMAMLDAGYETTQPARSLRNAVGVVLRGEPKLFKRDGEKWRTQ